MHGTGGEWDTLSVGGDKDPPPSDAFENAARLRVTPAGPASLWDFFVGCSLCVVFLHSPKEIH